MVNPNIARLKPLYTAPKHALIMYNLNLFLVDIFS